ncbi:MAG: carboxylating nicotinate-nucleotide diphosphorylase [Chryseolinea sp.]
MRPSYITPKFVQDFIALALSEDIGDGDHSSLAAIPANTQTKARLLVKDEGMLAGISLAGEIFQFFDKDLRVEVYMADGALAKRGDIAFSVHGAARSILSTERLVLNCLQRMSGIATKTSRLMELISGTGVKLLDTRKTTPNFRLLEKWAVSIGGGSNHRIGLYDMIMLKDNHIDMAGGIEKAIIQTKDYLRAGNHNLKIEIETRNLEEVKEVLRVGGVDIVMLDNMSPGQMRDAVTLIGGSYKTEASGNITEKTIREVAECGVDFISMGALTHSVRSLDLSLKAYDI